MTAQAANIDSPLFTRYVDLLVRLDRMMAADEGDSEEADSLRDVMEALWYQLNPAEIRIARQLSADLYSLHGDSQVTHADSPNVYSSALAASISSALQRAQYLDALELIQKRPADLSGERAARLRALCYERLGLIDVSLAFLRRAIELSSDPPRVQALLLAKLGQHRRISDGIAAAEEFLSGTQLPTIAVRKMAANLYIDFANLHRRVGTLQDEVLHKAAALCQSVLADVKMDADKAKDALDSLSILSNCYLLLGERHHAIECESNAISIDPLNSNRFVVRGMLRWPLDSSAALLDFHRSIELGTQHAWPYYFLAVDALRASDYALCIKMARDALRRTVDLTLLAKLHEWIAISLSSQSRSSSEIPSDEIREHFKLAMTFAPESHNLLANYQAFEAATANMQLQTNWEIGTSVDALFDSARISRLDEIVENEISISEYAY